MTPSASVAVPDSDALPKGTMSPPLQRSDSSGTPKVPEGAATQPQESLPLEPSAELLKRADSVVGGDGIGSGPKNKSKQQKKGVKGPRLRLMRVVGDMAYCSLQVKNQEIDFQFSAAEDSVEDITESMVSTWYCVQGNES